MELTIVMLNQLTLVNFAGINNSSPATLDIESLENFISITGNVTAGSSYNMTLKGNTDGASFKNYFRVFVSWNQDVISSMQENL